jgi:nucleoside-diphosphate-sugar epimerase
MSKVLITGATGFLGAAIVEGLVKENFEVQALKRKTSDCWRLAEIYDRITWVDIDGDEDWRKAVEAFNPTILIHAAWIGVNAEERDNEVLQHENIRFLRSLFEICLSTGINKFIGLGSQAEYGKLQQKVDENTTANPVTAYGKAKKESAELVRSFCEGENINWIWLRLFSFFGEKENPNWLIPSVIRKLQEEKEMNMTAGEQKYAYLYVRDFAALVIKILRQPVASGIYNVSAAATYSLKQIVEMIREKINPAFTFHFGAIPYREAQSMHLEGDVKKLESQIGPWQTTDFDTALNQTINYYINKNHFESI